MKPLKFIFISCPALLLTSCHEEPVAEMTCDAELPRDAALKFLSPYPMGKPVRINISGSVWEIMSMNLDARQQPAIAKFKFEISRERNTLKKEEYEMQLKTALDTFMKTGGSLRITHSTFFP